MSYRDNVEAFKRATTGREGEFVEPDDFRVIGRINEMRTGYSENDREYLSNIITAEALVCVMDRLDRVIELMEEVPTRFDEYAVDVPRSQRSEQGEGLTA